MLRALVSRGVRRRLVEEGFAVVDGALPLSVVRVARSEISSLGRRGALHANHTHVLGVGAGGEARLVAKGGIMEADVGVETVAVNEASPTLSALFRDQSLMDALEEGACPTDGAYEGMGAFAGQRLKVQLNEGGGACFPVHCDTDARGVDARRVTAIVYLNEGWTPAQGGQLRLYPFPWPHVDVEPEAGRMVLFHSASMLHRVLPARDERLCLTLWLHAAEGPTGGRPERPRWVPDTDGLRRACPDDPEGMEALLAPRLWMSFARLALAPEWRRSLEESHPDTPERRALLERNDAEMGIIRHALASRLGGDAARVDALASMLPLAQR